MTDPEPDPEPRGAMPADSYLAQRQPFSVPAPAPSPPAEVVRTEVLARYPSGNKRIAITTRDGSCYTVYLDPSEFQPAGHLNIPQKSPPRYT